MQVKRVMVIGLDGATFDLMRPWLAEGKLPTLARLIAEGASGEMESVPNMNSAAAWSSFATGLNPGKHGVYWLVEYKPNSYELQPTNALSRHGETIWARLSRRGRRVAVLNVPITWPAEPVNGVLVAGWDCPGVYSPGFTYPPEFAQELLRACDGEFVIRASSEAPEPTLDGSIRRMHEQTRSHLKAAQYVLAQGPWDLFIIVFTTTDIAHHLLWRTIDPTHPDYNPDEAARYGGAMYDIYRELDDAIAMLMGSLDDGTAVIVMSDHGGGISGGAVRYINKWLHSQGLLAYCAESLNGRGNRLSLGALNVRDELQKGVMWLLANVIWAERSLRILSEEQKQRIKGWLPDLRGLRLRAETRAYAAQIDWSRTLAYGDNANNFVRVNLKGREPQGIVAPEDYESVRNRVIERLYTWCDPASGRPLVEKVYKREEIYSGPYTEVAADLEIRWTDVVPQGLDSAWMDGPRFDPISGGHKPNGILIMRGPGIARGATIEGAKLLDMAPTLLHLMGGPVPATMDGKVLTQAFTPAYLAAHPIVYDEERQPLTATPLTSATAEAAYSDDDMREVEARLRMLGYMA